MKKEILILGGGIGGQVAANILGKEIGRKHHVVLIDRKKEFVFSPSLLWFILGQRTPQDITRPISRLAKK